MPPHLASAGVSWEDFFALHCLYRKRHNLQVAVEFSKKVGAWTGRCA